MPSPELTYLRQRAVLWPFAGYDKYGQAVVGSPVEIRVRWLTVRQEAVGPNGNTISMDGTAIVVQRVEIGSQLWLGTLGEWYGINGTGSATINTDEEVMEVKTYSETPDLKNRFVYRNLGLMRLRDRK